MRPSSLTTCWAVFLLACLAAIAGTTSAQEVQPLPPNPQAVCTAARFTPALLVCKSPALGTQCCSGLDALFGRHSPSAGCLCLPQVLRAAMAATSQHGLDLLATLQGCRAANASFETAWASGPGGVTSCPAPLSTHAAPGSTNGLLDALGASDAVIIPSRAAVGPWAWSNMKQFGEVMWEVPGLQDVAQQKLFGSKALQLVFLVMVCTPPAFLILHHGVLMRCSGAYRHLSQGDRLIACQHAVYALVFSLMLVPQTVLAFKSLFFAWTGSYVASSELLVMVGVFIATRAVLYEAEAAMRSVVKWSWLLVIHHLLFFTIVVLVLWSGTNGNPALLGIGIVLDLVACHEAPLYWALLGYRLRWRARTARAVLRGACVWYVLTRVLQTVLLVYMIAAFAGMPAVRQDYGFVITSVLCGAFTVIQSYTLRIYWAIDVKLSQRIMQAQAAAAQGALGQASRSQSADVVVEFGDGGKARVVDGSKACTVSTSGSKDVAAMSDV